MGRLAGLAAIALCLVVAGAVIVAPSVSLEQRAAALVTITTAIVLIGRLSANRR